MLRRLGKLQLTRTSRMMCRCILGLGSGLLGLGLVASALWDPWEPPAAFALGLGLGCALSLGKVVLLEKSTNHLLDISKGWAQGLSAMHTLLRYLLTAGVLALAFAYPQVVGRVGTILGTLALQPAAHLTGWLLRERL